MPIELQYLISAAGLYLFMIVVQAAIATLSGKATVSELVGPRDDMPAGGLSVFHGRAKRAQANFTEGMVMFIPLCLIAVYSNETSSLTALGAILFFYGRLAYTPLYYFGVPWLRTLAWAVSIIGILLFFVELLT
jgi:uncharacterized MAPEG superfamily protein